ncbi:hypothetical protein D3C72_1252630 [compost metagenome]
MPERRPTGEGRGAGEQHGQPPCNSGAHRKVEDHALLGLADARQRHHLHVGKGRHQARQQADDAGKQLLGIHAGAQHQQYAGKADEDSEYQRNIECWLIACRLGPPGHERAAHDKGRDPETAHVVERHGGGQGQFADGVEPEAHREHADEAAPGVHQRVLRAQADALAPGQPPQQGHADEAPVEDDLGRVVVGRCELDAHAHECETKGGGHHPQGLHRNDSVIKKLLALVVQARAAIDLIVIERNYFAKTASFIILRYHS